MQQKSWWICTKESSLLTHYGPKHAIKRHKNSHNDQSHRREAHEFTIIIAKQCQEIPHPLKLCF
jgi:hypothetical protein